MNRPITTLFMLESLDGKISSGSSDNLDTDIFSLNTGRVMAKIGVNDRKEYHEKIDVVTFVIIDNKPHLNENECNKLEDSYIQLKYEVLK